MSKCRGLQMKGGLALGQGLSATA